MAEEIQEAVQIIRVAYDGIDIAMKVGSDGISAMQKMLVFLKEILDYEKLIGETSMRKLLMKGGDLQVFQFKTEDMSKVKKLAKKYGVLYSVLPDVNKEDGMSEIIFHCEAVPRVNMMIQKLKSGKIESFDEYVKNGDADHKMGNDELHTEEVGNIQLLENAGIFAIQQKEISVETLKGNLDITETQAEKITKLLETMKVLEPSDKKGGYRVIIDQESFVQKIREYQELSDRMNVVSKVKKDEVFDVTISRTLVKEENQNAIKTRIPGTWGENVRYIWIRKENIVNLYKGKTMLTFLVKEKEYKIYDKENRVVQTMNGERLYSEHYDEVESKVRERYENVRKKGNVKKRKMVKSGTERRR